MAGAAVLMLCGLTGCEHHFFSVHGRIASEGGTLGTWRSAPLGCTRDPQDGAKPDQPTSTLAEFLWSDPRKLDRPPDPLPERPVRLTLSQNHGAYAGTLRMVQRPDVIAFGPGECTRMDIETHETAPQIQGGHPALAGRVQLDCRIEGSHVTADLRFSGCEF